MSKLNWKSIENPFFYDENLYPGELSDLGLEKFIFHRELARVIKYLEDLKGPFWLIFPSQGGGRVEIDFFSLVFRYFLNSKEPLYFPSLIRADFLIQNAPSNALRLVASRFTPEVWRRSFYNFLKSSVERLEREGTLLEALPEADKVKNKLKEGEEKIDGLLFPVETKEDEEELAFSVRDFCLRMMERENMGSVVKRLTEATFIWQSWEEGVKQFQNDVFLPHQAKEGIKGLFKLISNAYQPVLMFTSLERLASISEEQLAAVNGFLVEIESLLHKSCYFIYEVLENELSALELVKRGKELRLSFWPLFDLPLDSVAKAVNLAREQLKPFLPLDFESEELIGEEVIEKAFQRKKDPQEFLSLLGKAWEKAGELGQEKITLEIVEEVSG